MTIREKIQARELERANQDKNAIVGIVISAAIGLVQIVIALLK